MSSFNSGDKKELNLDFTVSSSFFQYGIISSLNNFFSSSENINLWTSRVLYSSRSNSIVSILTSGYIGVPTNLVVRVPTRNSSFHILIDMFFKK